MLIEIWSDFVCPFCYIGKRRLEDALDLFPNKEEVEVVFKSYQLDPHAEVNTTVSMHEALANKYGTTIERAKEMNQNVANQALSVGLQFNIEDMVHTNTFDAHRLAKYAYTQGLETVLTERLLKAHFTEGKNIGKHTILIQLAEEVGLDKHETKLVLESNQFEDLVLQEQQLGSQIGVKGVPFFVFNQKYAVSGAQPIEVFSETLRKVWLEENNRDTIEEIATDDGQVCDDEHCELPSK